jgi:hypothetical protein
MPGIYVFSHFGKTTFCSVRKSAVSATEMCGPIPNIILRKLAIIS